MNNNLADRAYESISDAIASGKHPPGAVLSEHTLARQLETSRTPVREALRRLQHEGVVKQVPRYGTIVCPPDRRKLRELYELREALECYAVESAVHRITPRQLDTLDVLAADCRQLAYELRRSDPPVLHGERLRFFLETDRRFHLLLLSAAGNREIIQTVHNSRVLTGIFGTYRQSHTLSVVANTYRHHQRIARAVRRKKPDDARYLLSYHIQQSRRRALDDYEQADYAVPEPMTDRKAGLTPL